MCGIYGVIANSSLANAFFNLAGQANQYRGPDGSNRYECRINGNNIKLGHTRLVITGDELHGMQPVVNEKIILVYNGEIFNFENVHVDGISDTELLVQLIEDGISDDKLNSLNGFFAFAAYYPKTDSIFLVRDRFGEKPLYYSFVNGELCFSSAAMPFKVIGVGTIASIKDSPGGGIVFDENQPAVGIKQVPPGCMLCLSRGSFSIRKWYKPQAMQYYLKKDYSKVVDSFNNILIDSVKIRTKDQNSVAVSLSGGLDSTLVVDTIKRIGGVGIEAFTLSTSDPRFDELDTVRHHASKIGVKLNVVNEPLHDLEQFSRCLEVLEFPSYNFSFVGYDSYYKAVRDTGTRVIIEGHGPDEYLGGYATMFIGYMAGLLLRGDFRSFRVAISACANTFGLTPARSMLSVLLTVFRSFRQGNLPSGSSVNHRFFNALSIPLVLRTFDRISMLNKIETRSPFMDFRLVELGKSLPDEILFYGGRSKSILRTILEDRGFKDSDFGPKIGFTATYDDVLHELCRLNGINELDLDNIRSSGHKSSFKIASAMSQHLFS